MSSRRHHRQLDLERNLRDGRAEPRADFTRFLAAEVRGRSAPERSPRGRAGVMIALAGLAVVALASFGGVGYASSTAPKTPATSQAPRIVGTSAASAQYGPFTPPKPKPAPSAPAGGTAGSGAGTAGSGAAGAQAAQAPPAAAPAQLPFTGLALWVPLGFGSLLIAVGIFLRTRGRRRQVPVR